MPPASQSKLYNLRHPERTLLYQTVAEHYETWAELASAGQFDGHGDYRTPKSYVRQAFAKYLECGIFAHGFARARCADCAHDYFVAFSCKGRGVCPSCSTRRMAETAAHLTDHVFPRLPVRQWVLSVPKRLRYFMRRDGAVLNMVLRIFLRVIAQSLQASSPGAAHVNKAALHIGAVAFIHRFDSSLNEHVHFHVCVVDRVFEELAGGTDGDTDDQSLPRKVIFHPASAIDQTTVAQVQATLRRRILRAFVGRGLLESFEAKEMLGYKHSGFSVDTSCASPANAVPIAPEPKRSPAHYLWAVLIARIYEVLPLLCPFCGGQMRIIAFITYSAEIRQILDHIGVDSEPPRLSPARGPPMWDADAQRGEEGQALPDWDLQAQSAPDYGVGQRIS